jgi:hypothetical protein
VTVDDRAVRQLVAAAAVARVVRFDLQVLDREILIAEELRTIGQVVERQLHVVMNDQAPSLGAFGGPRPLSIRSSRLLLTGWRGRAAGVIEWTGLRRPFRLFRQPLESPKLRFQLFDSLLLFLDRRLQLFDDAEQRFDERGPLLHRNLNSANSRCAWLPCHAQREALNPICVKTDFHHLIEK